MSERDCNNEGFCGIGRWRGTAEVYSGTGQFLANAADERHVRTLTEDGRIRIDLAFVGPFKFSGHYFIHEHPDRRLYRGPANYGHAESLGKNAVDANAYWPAVGLSQRYFLTVLPDNNHQLSLAYMHRGDQLMYVVVGDYQRVQADGTQEVPGLTNGTAHDLARDPTAGRGEILLHRPGEWVGELTALSGDMAPAGGTVYRERVFERPHGVRFEVDGGGFGQGARFDVTTDGYAAWTPGGDVVGSYSMSGGRALSGYLHHLPSETRVWRREIVRHDGTVKAVIHVWYRGGQRVGVQHGVLRFVAK